MRLLTLSLRTATRPVRWSAAIFVALSLLYVITVPWAIGVTLGEHGAGAIGGGGIGMTWGRPAETGFYPEPGLHIKQRGWAVYAWQWNYDSTNKWADAPLWPLLVATLLPFAVHTSRTRRRQRRGRCVWCGYDLGTLGQCPECGRVTKAGTQRYLREQKGA
jgi:hypothetical protein